MDGTRRDEAQQAGLDDYSDDQADAENGDEDGEDIWPPDSDGA